MDADYDALEREKLQLLQQLAELEVEQQRRRELFQKVTHFSEIDDARQNLGRRLSRLSQTRLANEIAAGEPVSRECPTCGQACRVEVGPGSTARSKSWNRRHIARFVAGNFFPQREALGFDSRESTPRLVAAVIHILGEAHSFERAELMLRYPSGGARRENRGK